MAPQLPDESSVSSPASAVQQAPSPADAVGPLEPEQLLPLVYDELRRIAHRQLRLERHDHTLNTTGLVHEAYLRLAAVHRLGSLDRAHFFAVAARAMRRVLIDHARRYHALKRPGSRQRIPLEETELPVEERAGVLLALDEALERLAQLDGRQARVVECRFFGGMTEEETATALGIAPRTVRRDWAKAKGWLYAELHDDS